MKPKEGRETLEIQVFHGRDRLGPKAGVKMGRMVPERHVWVKVGQAGLCRPGLLSFQS